MKPKPKHATHLLKISLCKVHAKKERINMRVGV